MRAMNNTLRKTLVLVLGLACLCAASPLWASEAVTVTLPPLAGLVRILLPDARVQCLLPAHADPHRFTLSPRQIEQWHHARLVVRSMADDAGWSFLDQQRKASTLSLWEHEPHGWLDPQRLEPALDTLAAGLSKAFPEKAAEIRSRLPGSKAMVQRIIREWQQGLTRLKPHGVILQHASWLPLMKASGVKVHLLLEAGPHGAGHTPHLLEQAVGLLRKDPSIWLIGDIRHDSRTLEWLANQVHPPARWLSLDPIGTCGEPWDALMHNNLRHLLEH
ncbi:MAG: manganese-binding protein [Zetaproteobacteria bacterium]|nr:MAG: manganese-binding protein [Zetaproteobacteria bacterium]